MIMRTNCTDKYNLTMTLRIDDESEEITIHIKFWNKKDGVINEYDYPAAEYSTALAKYRELENVKIEGESRLRATHILWDVDYDDNGPLPKEIDIPEGMTDEEEISDYLSEMTGYCHQGFNLVQI